MQSPGGALLGCSLFGMYVTKYEALSSRLDAAQFPCRFLNIYK